MPAEIVVCGVATPAQAAAVLASQCGIADALALLPDLAASSALREEGNVALEAGDAPRALAVYSECLGRFPGRTPHLLLANRSAARLRLGDAPGALADAAAAAAAAPSWHKPWLRAADAHFALGDVPAALADCREAEAREPALRRSAKHNLFLRQLQAMT